MINQNQPISHLFVMSIYNFAVTFSKIEKFMKFIYYFIFHNLIIIDYYFT